MALFLDNWLSVIVAVVILLLIIFYGGYKLRGLVDFLRGLKPFKEGWNHLLAKVDAIANDADFLKSGMMAMRRREFSDSASPAGLNDMGIKVTGLIEADELAKKYASHVKTEENESAYSIQEKCFDFALEELPDLLTSQEKKSIEDVAFGEGAETAIIFDTVLGISLRDFILKGMGVELNPSR